MTTSDTQILLSVVPEERSPVEVVGGRMARMGGGCKPGGNMKVAVNAGHQQRRIATAASVCLYSGHVERGIVEGCGWARTNRVAATCVGADAQPRH